MRPELKDLEALARSAGEIVRAGYQQQNNVNMKGVIDLVTEVDKASESYLLNEIRAKFPGHSIVAEESGKTAGDDGQTWYIDPLDGTTNFAHKLPIFSVSIAFVEAGEIILGVVYNPMSDELFKAERGAGAWLNEVPLKVGSSKALASSLLVTGFPYDRFSNPDNNLNNFAHFALQVQGIRRLGSAALDLCNVAVGRVDGYWEVRLEACDLAAGTLIAREAGAVVTNLDGGQTMLASPYSVVAANPELHSLMLEELGKVGHARD